jgi:hypothetical protein
MCLTILVYCDIFCALYQLWEKDGGCMFRKLFSAIDSLLVEIKEGFDSL